MLKNIRTIVKLCSFHTISRYAQNRSKQALIVHEPITSRCTSCIQKRQRKQSREQIVNILWIIDKTTEFQKYNYFCFIGCTKAFDYVDHNKLWKILKEMGIPDHLTCFLRNLMQVKKWQNQTWNNGLVQNWERSTSRLNTVTLLTELIFRVHHAKCWAGWLTSWNQDCWEKYQQPQICKWHHSNEGAAKKEIVGWHHLLNGNEFESTPGDSEGQGSLVCCSPCVPKESDTT